MCRLGERPNPTVAAAGKSRPVRPSRIAPACAVHRPGVPIEALRRIDGRPESESSGAQTSLERLDGPSSVGEMTGTAGALRLQRAGCRGHGRGLIDRHQPTMEGDPERPGRASFDRIAIEPREASKRPGLDRVATFRQGMRCTARPGGWAEQVRRANMQCGGGRSEPAGSRCESGASPSL
jgi:hypothetical protein